MLSLYVAVQDR